MGRCDHAGVAAAYHSRTFEPGQTQEGQLLRDLTGLLLTAVPVNQPVSFFSVIKAAASNSWQRRKPAPLQLEMLSV